jgi:DNA-binding FrmR family transcriptional regulator
VAEETKTKRVRSVDTRLAIIEGNIKSLRKMVAGGIECKDLITQILAIEHALKSAGVSVLRSRIDALLNDGASENASAEAAECGKLLEMFL